MNAPARQFEAKPAVRGEEPLSIGMVGPPGGGKSYSALRLAKGMQEVRGGDVVLIDTEGGRARKYADEFKFLHVDFAPPHRPDHFLDAITQQIARKPACIIVDSMSDEHEGQGGYLEWHDANVQSMGGNEWAAWAKPKAARKRLITGLLQIKTPLIFTFRAREKTQQVNDDKGKKKVINIGWQPVAPLEIVHALDLTCILPPRADGVPVWKSDKIGEDFIIKLPQQFKRLFAGNATQLTEETGRALAEWARGGQPSSAPTRSPAPDHAAASEDRPASNNGASPAGAAAKVPTPDDYVQRWEVILEEATDAKALHEAWSADRSTRNRITWPDDDTFDRLKDSVAAKIDRLKQQTAT